MKKIIFTLATVFFLTVQGCFANIDMEKVYDQYQIVYLPSSNTFTTGAMQDDRIVLKKIATIGTGNYSMYFYSDGKIAFRLPTSFEFIWDSRLIACDNANLKYYEVYYKAGRFLLKDLSHGELKKIFPEAKVVKVSKFKNGKMTVRTKKDYLLLFNNTKEYFYKYSTTPEHVGSTDIRGLFDVSEAKDITFSHYGEDSILFKKYQIIVK